MYLSNYLLFSYLFFLKQLEFKSLPMIIWKLCKPEVKWFATGSDNIFENSLIVNFSFIIFGGKLISIYPTAEVANFRQEQLTCSRTLYNDSINIRRWGITIKLWFKTQEMFQIYHVQCMWLWGSNLN